MDSQVSARPHADEAGVTGLLAALPEEMAPLRRRLRDERRLSGRLGLVCGRLEHVPVVLGVTGDGPRQAQQGLQALFDTLAVRRLLVIGVSGALSPDLVPGDLLIGARVVDELTHSELFAPDALLAHAERTTRARRGVLVSATQIADTPSAKRRLLARFAEGQGPAAVDLESHAYARAADAAGVPWLCLRSISDAADEALPRLLERSRGASGGVSRSRVALGMLREPRLIPTLWRLERRLERSASLLARAVEALLAADPDRALPFPGSPASPSRPAGRPARFRLRASKGIDDEPT